MAARAGSVMSLPMMPPMTLVAPRTRAFPVGAAKPVSDMAPGSKALTVTRRSVRSDSSLAIS